MVRSRGTINCSKPTGPLEISVCKIFLSNKLLKINDKTQTAGNKDGMPVWTYTLSLSSEETANNKALFFRCCRCWLKSWKKRSLLFYSDNQNFWGGLHMVSNRWLVASIICVYLKNCRLWPATYFDQLKIGFDQLRKKTSIGSKPLPKCLSDKEYNNHKHWLRSCKWRGRERESWIRGQQTYPLTVHFKMWTVSSDVRIQRRHWQPLSVHL